MSTYPEQSNGVLTAGLYKSSPRADPGEGDVAAASTALTRTTRMYAAPPQDESEVVASTTSHCAAEVKDPWSGSSVLGATVRTGNIDDAGVSEETSLSYDEDRWHHRAKAAGDYLRNRTEIQEQSSEGEYEVRYGLDSRRFTYGLARYEDDRLSGFDFEITSSAGLGRHLVKEGGHEWTVPPGAELPSRPAPRLGVAGAVHGCPLHQSGEVGAA